MRPSIIKALRRHAYTQDIAVGIVTERAVEAYLAVANAEVSQ